MKGALGEWSISTLIFVVYFLNFTFADLETSLSIYDSLLSPERTAYIIWIPVYAGLFGFVSYQLLHGSARRSKLVQRKIPVPWIVHQCVYSAWLLSYSEGMLLPTAILGTLMWTLTLFSYLLITIEFRSGRYEEYTVEDWLLIETPFALQLGWETFLALLGWNVWSVKLTHSTGLATPAIELSAFIVSVALVVQAAVLFAGLPMVMNPWLHVGLAWGCGWVAVRWLRNRQNDITVACGLSALAACITCLFYFLVSLAIMCQSKFCLPEIVEPNLDARATAAVRDRGGCTDRGGCNDRGGYSERGAYMERGGYSEPASSALPTANGLPNANGLLHQSYRQSGFNSPSLPHSPHEYRAHTSGHPAGGTLLNPERLLQLGLAPADIYDQNAHNYQPGTNYLSGSSLTGTNLTGTNLTGIHQTGSSQMGTNPQTVPQGTYPTISAYQPRLACTGIEFPSNSNNQCGSLGPSETFAQLPPNMSPKTARSHLTNENRTSLQTPKAGMPPTV